MVGKLGHPFMLCVVSGHRGGGKEWRPLPFSKWTQFVGQHFVCPVAEHQFALVHGLSGCARFGHKIGRVVNVADALQPAGMSQIGS